MIGKAAFEGSSLSLYRSFWRRLLSSRLDRRTLPMFRPIQDRAEHRVDASRPAASPGSVTDNHRNDALIGSRAPAACRVAIVFA